MAINEPMGSSRLRAAAGNARKSGARAAMFWMFALVMGLGTALFIAKYLDKRSGGPVVPITKIAVAAVDLPLAGKIQLESLKLEDWPADHLPAGVFRDPKELAGRILISRVLAGQPILPGMLAAKNAGNGLAALIPPNMRAMAVRVDDVVGVAGFIHPDDRVDVMVTLHPQRPGAETTTKLFMQNVKVLAVGQEVEANDQARMHASPATVATLLVSPHDAERLALASSEGRLLLTLRSWTDSLPVNTDGAVAEELVGDPSAAAPTTAKAAEPARPMVAARHGKGHPAAAAPPPALLPGEGGAPKRDVVEILRGDRFEERKFNKGDNRQ
ncbi:MAG TPA: Flp pilus assembly protein CpaB [Polyangia bacterium]|nr:Flp pilus assembly protein CpaB [Polyangia bacterium]